MHAMKNIYHKPKPMMSSASASSTWSSMLSAHCPYRKALAMPATTVSLSLSYCSGSLDSVAEILRRQSRSTRMTMIVKTGVLTKAWMLMRSTLNRPSVQGCGNLCSRFRESHILCAGLLQSAAPYDDVNVKRSQRQDRQ